MDRHHAIMYEAIESNNVFVFEIVGDAFCCAFENASNIKAAVDAQIRQQILLVFRRCSKSSYNVNLN